MKEQFITFETAKLAKEKGFDIPTIQFYTSGKKAYLSKAEDYMTERYAESNWNNGRGSYPTEPEKVSCSAPTQSLLHKWLREKHNIDVVISPERYYTGVNYLVQAQKWDLNADPEVKLNFVIKGSCWYNDNHEYPTYEEALEKGLQEALKLIEL